MKLKIPRLRPHLAHVKMGIVHHFNYHRIHWALAVAVVCFALGWLLHNDRFIHFAEFTLAPILEAILSKKLEG